MKISILSPSGSPPPFCRAQRPLEVRSIPFFPAAFFCRVARQHLSNPQASFHRDLPTPTLFACVDLSPECAAPILMSGPPMPQMIRRLLILLTSFGLYLMTDRQKTNRCLSSEHSMTFRDEECHCWFHGECDAMTNAACMHLQLLFLLFLVFVSLSLITSFLRRSSRNFTRKFAVFGFLVSECTQKQGELEKRF